MSKLKCPQCGADIGAVVAANAGRATSRAKAEAARRNAKKGGWPKGRPRKKTSAWRLVSVLDPMVPFIVLLQITV